MPYFSTEDWSSQRNECEGLRLLDEVLPGPAYSTRWQLSDSDPKLPRRCETMVRILCKATNLKDDDRKLKGQTIWSRICTRCDLGAPEDAIHMIMQCPANAIHRGHLSNEIKDIYPGIEPHEFLGIVLGNEIEGWTFNEMQSIWEISAKYVSYMYYDTTKSIGGVG